MELRPGYKLTEAGIIPGDWEARPLKELGSFKNGINKGKEDFGYGFPFVNLMDVFGTNKIFSNAKMGLVHSNVVERKTYELKRSDVIFVRSSVKPDGVGLTTLVENDLPNTVFSGFLIRFVSDDRLTREYKEFCFSETYFRDRLVASSTISANTNINQNALKKLVLAFPSKHAEQRAIAAALSDTDALLTSLDRLLAKKRDIKQAVMQQLLTGKQRLPGLSGEWTVKQLGDFGKCLRGVSYKGDTDLSSHDTDTTIRLLRSNNVQEAAINTKDVQYVNCERVSAQQKMQASDVLICMANGSKELVGKAGIFKINDGHTYTFGAFMGCYRTQPQMADPAFMFFLFQTNRYRDYINNLLAGSSINNLKPSAIESLEFYVPLRPEQTAIAGVLSDMDAEIEALQQRRNKTRAIKQGMMQELLTGRIRLV